MHVLDVDKIMVELVVLVDELLLEIFQGLIVRLHLARSNFWFEGISF